MWMMITSTTATTICMENLMEKWYLGIKPFIDILLIEKFFNM